MSKCNAMKSWRTEMKSRFIALLFQVHALRGFSERARSWKRSRKREIRAAAFSNQNIANRFHRNIGSTLNKSYWLQSPLTASQARSQFVASLSVLMHKILLLSRILVSAASRRVHRPCFRRGRFRGLPLLERGLRQAAGRFRRRPYNEERAETLYE
jgi:hypothetical protein